MSLSFFGENSVFVSDSRSTLFHDPSVKSSLSTIRSIRLSFCLSLERLRTFQHIKVIHIEINKSYIKEGHK